MAPKGKKEEPKAQPEEDASEDKRKKIATKVVINDLDTTLDVFVAGMGTVLSAMSADAFQYLLSGARANIGMTKGRYLFEVRILEVLSPAMAQGQAAQRAPRQLVRVGVSTEKSSLILGETADNVCFDSEGAFIYDSVRSVTQERFGKEDVVGCLVNLEEGSPNEYTISFYRNGKRAGDVFTIPEKLRGQPLFPTVSFKNVSLSMNFGGSKGPWKELPFKCNTMNQMAEADSAKSAVARPTGKDGKYEVVVPIGLPDEGMFDWADSFLKKNPHFVELSDRKIIEWCEMSGLRRKGTTPTFTPSNDKPQFNFGMPSLDEYSMSKVMSLLAASLRRHVLVLEMKANLLKAERIETVQRFHGDDFKRIASVVMGKPDKTFIDAQHEYLKEEKKKSAAQKKKIEDAKLQADRLRKLADVQRKRAELARQQRAREVEKQAQKAAKKAAKEAAKKKKEEEEKAKAEEAEKAKEEEKKEGEEVKAEDGEEKKDVEMKTEETKKEEEPKDVEMKKEEEEEEEEEDDGPDELADKLKEADEEIEKLKKPVEYEITDDDLKLTPEEEKKYFRQHPLPDMTPAEIAASIAKFSLPDDDEGFDEVRYLWAKKDGCQEAMKKFVLNKKITEKIESLAPGAWFKEKHDAWAKERDALKKRVQAFTADKETRKQKKEEKEKQELAKKAEDGEDKKMEDAEEDYIPEDEEDLLTAPDVWTSKDVHNTKGGAPLYWRFELEDWALLNLRYELHLLAHAYKKDANDEERLGIHENNVAFYYQRYFRRPFQTQSYGCPDLESLMKLLRDGICIEPDNRTLQSDLDADTEEPMFLKLTEEARRERKRLIDLGDESARLKFTVPAGQTASKAGAPGAGRASAAGMAQAMARESQQQGMPQQQGDNSGVDNIANIMQGGAVRPKPGGMGGGMQQPGFRPGFRPPGGKGGYGGGGKGYQPQQVNWGGTASYGQQAVPKRPYGGADWGAGNKRPRAPGQYQDAYVQAANNMGNRYGGGGYM